MKEFRQIKVDRKFPLYFSLLSFVFIYLVSDWILLLTNSITYDCSLGALIQSYFFVAFGSILFLSGLRLGLNKNKLHAPSTSSPLLNSSRRSKNISLFSAILIIFLFALWSQIMLHHKIGTTIYTDFEPLPFRLTGILFYGRLLLQPFILCYVALGFRESKQKWFVGALIIILGCWASLTSGSRFIGILFAFPLLLIFPKRVRSIALASALSINIIISSLSRNFFLPYSLDVNHLISIYANNVYKESVLNDVWLTPFTYVLGRIMGINTVLMTLTYYGDAGQSLSQSFLTSINSFFPLLNISEGVSMKNIYGLSDDAFGGFGLDFFSNLWVSFGGTLLFFSLGTLLLGWLSGYSYITYCKTLLKYNLSLEALPYLYVILFIIIFENRLNLVLPILATFWFVRQPVPFRFVKSLLKFKL